MIKNITIEGFKCFHERQSIPLSQINLLYGKNGRGKSTIAQSFLLLAQTMKECKDQRNNLRDFIFKHII